MKNVSLGVGVNMPLKLHKYRVKSKQRQREDIEIYSEAYSQGYFDAHCDLQLALSRSKIGEKKKFSALMIRVFRSNRKSS